MILSNYMDIELAPPRKRTSDTKVIIAIHGFTIQIRNI